MRKILVTRSYIMLKSGNLEFFVGRKYFRLLKAAIEEAEYEGLNIKSDCP